MKFLLPILLLLCGTILNGAVGDAIIQVKTGTNTASETSVTKVNGNLIGWDGSGTLTSITPATGTVTSFSATDSTGIDFTVTNPTSSPTLSLSLTKAAVGLGNVENTALSTWAGSSNISQTGTITTGTWSSGVAVPDGLFALRDVGANSLTFSIVPLTAGRTFTLDVGDADRSLTFSADATIGGVNSGDQTITLTGDVTGSGTGSFAATLANTAVTPGSYTNANVTVDSKGRITAAANGSGGGGSIGGTVGTVDNRIPRSDGTGGSTLQASLALLDDTGNVTIPNGAYYKVNSFSSDPSTRQSSSLQFDRLEFMWLDSTAAPILGSLIPPVTDNPDPSWTLPDTSGTLLLTNGSGASLTALNANNISSGTLAVARGGSGATTLSANAVLLGNGTSAVQTVAPSTSGNVLTSNGTTWTSAAPATTNPSGSGSELQFRSSGSAFGAVTDSSVSGAALTLGNAAALGATTTPYLTLRNTTAAAAGAQQVSPSLVLEGQGWKTTATAASQTVRFRQNVLPVQGTTNPTGSWRLQSEINNSGTWNDTISVESAGTLRMIGGSSVTQSIRGPTVGIYDSGGNALGFCVGTTLISYVESNGFFLNGASQGYWILTDTALMRDAAGVFAQRNSTNAQTFRIYNTYSSSTNYERASLGWASNVFQVKPEKGSGGGTSRTAEYHTTETGVKWTSGTGTPEGAVTAPVGSLFTRTDGGASTTLYVKESGSGNTGWVAK